MDGTAWGVIGTAIGAIVGFITLYQQLRHKQTDVELENARERTRKAEVELEQVKRESATTKITAETTKDEVAQQSALIRLVENVVGANVRIAEEIPAALNMIREASEQQSAENLNVIQSVTQSAKGALAQLGGANERYTAIQGLVGSTHQLIAALNTKIDNMNCADKQQIRKAIREVEQETLGKLQTGEIPQVGDSPKETP